MKIYFRQILIEEKQRNNSTLSNEVFILTISFLKIILGMPREYFSLQGHFGREYISYFLGKSFNKSDVRNLLLHVCRDAFR